MYSCHEEGVRDRNRAGIIALRFASLRTWQHSSSIPPFDSLRSGHGSIPARFRPSIHFAHIPARFRS
eukprot:gene15103-biopygen4156